MTLRPRSTWRPLAVLTALAVAFALLPLGTAVASTSTVELERDFGALVNVERAKQGLGALEVRSDIVKVARNHSQTMADEWRLHHNPDFSTEITGWQRLAENVGYGPNVGAIHRALMNSEGHRRNILDDRVTEIGIGVVVKDGRVWVTQNFRRPSATVTVFPPSTERFGDVRSTSVHAASIETVAVRGITDSCGEARYCPSTSVTRGAFAVMLVRALGLDTGPSGESRFTDTSGEVAAAAEALASEGLTSGCSSDRFCPTDRLSRAQLATFFAGALQLSPRTPSFTDAGTTHAGSIGALEHAGIVNGCTSITYCPSKKVTRAQTASMFANNLG
ncbi:MAG: CAP domain-containing protein [Nitriliruptoraceae bacterium]